MVTHGQFILNHYICTLSSCKSDLTSPLAHPFVCSTGDALHPAGMACGNPPRSRGVSCRFLCLRPTGARRVELNDSDWLSCDDTTGWQYSSISIHYISGLVHRRHFEMHLLGLIRNGSTGPLIELQTACSCVQVRVCKLAGADLLAFKFHARSRPWLGALRKPFEL